MLVYAENVPEWQTTRAHAAGHIPLNHQGYYVEYQLDNCMEETIYLIDENGHQEAIPGVFTGVNRKRVDIVRRFVPGPKTINNSGHDVTKCQHQITTIPYDYLRKQPVYSATLNRIICTAQHLQDVIHPMNTEARKSALLCSMGTMSDIYLYIPFYMFGNDPTGKITNVYTIVNDAVISIPLTHMETEAGFFCLRYRPADIDDDQPRNYRIGFDEIAETKSHTWEMHGFTFSTNKDLLFQKIATEKRKQLVKERETEELQERLDEAEKYHTLDKEALEKENDRLTKRLADQKKYYEKLIETRYDEKKADLEIQKLDLEQKKIDSEKKNISRTERIETQKVHKERLGTLSTILKFLSMAIPICIGLFKILKPA